MEMPRLVTHFYAACARATLGMTKAGIRRGLTSTSEAVMAGEASRTCIRVLPETRGWPARILHGYPRWCPLFTETPIRQQSPPGASRATCPSSSH